MRPAERLHTSNKNTEALAVVGKEVGLEVYAERSMCMVMSRGKNAGQNHIMKIDNNSFEMVVHLETNITKQNCIPIYIYI
jgi:hypothetical protein